MNSCEIITTIPFTNLNAFVITDTELLGSRVSDDGELWLDDAVEVFIDAKHNAAAVGEMSEEQYLREGGRLWGRYRVFLQDDDFHFIVNVRNTIATCRGKGLDFADSSWDADIPYSVLVHGTINVNTDVDEGYAVEMGIPWKAIGVKPRSRMVLGADFAIEDVDPEKRFPSDWCELAHFTQPHKFGHIVLEGGPDISVPQTKKALWIVSGVLVAIGITGLVFWRNRRRLLTGEAETADITEHRLERIARQAQAYIEEHYTSDELTTAQAARHLCVSERYLQMILKKQGKPSFRDMLSAYRVERAEAFLVGTDKNVTEIAFDVGFNSPDTFSAAFRKRYGMSPSEFRKNHRAKG